ncbi:uncharacterized protein L201_006309 [Kwoniella dendrophila CBS 6074]|uniref:RING-type E3 ubiquitin transferase n=1 Tax=Kwoniella dendrophila CBS 6074 TaxID=1295534 RepID=A0AAX4K0V9_9TREE
MTEFMPAIPPHHDEEEDVCRVCRVEGDEADPLIHPCKCSGSVKFVHPDCLKQWLAQTGKKHCEICGHKYTFTKIYPEKLPDTIPPTVYVRQSILWVYRKQLWIARCILVVSVWLIVLPSLNMFSLRSLLWIADHIGYSGPTSNDDVPQGFVGNATDFSLANATESIVLNITSTSNSSIPNNTAGTTKGDVVFRPVSTLIVVIKRAVEEWMKGDENSVISYVLRGQILSISLAAVLIGLILLREWITQHNFQEGTRPQIVEQGEINPDEWMIFNGVARKTTDVMAAILGNKRAARERRMHEMAENEEEVEEREQEAEASLRAYQRTLDREQQIKEDQEDQESDSAAERRKAGMDLESIRFRANRTPFREDIAIPDKPDAVVAALQEYRRSHRLAEKQAAQKELEKEVFEAGVEFDQMMDEALLSSRMQPPSPSFQDRYDGESDAGPSRPRLERVGTEFGEAKPESVLMEPKSDSRKSFKEREEVAYKAPELLEKGKGKEEQSEDSNEAGPSDPRTANGGVEEGDIPLFLPPSPTRTASSSSSAQNNVFRAGDTIRFDEHGNILHEFPRPATTEGDIPIIPAPRPAEVANEDEDADWEDEDDGDANRDAEIREIADNVAFNANGLGNLPGIEIRPIQVADVAAEEPEEEPWDRDDWNGILEVVGLMGPLHGLFQNVLFGVIIMSAAISIFIGLPLLIGKLFLSTDMIRTSLTIARRTLYLIRKVTDPVVDIVFEILKEVVILPFLAAVRGAETIIARKLGLDDRSVQGDMLTKLTSILSLSSSTSSTSIPIEDITDKGKHVALLGDGLAWVGQHAFDAYSAYVQGKRRISISDSVSGRMITVLSGYGTAAGIVGLIALPGDHGGAISRELSKIVRDHAMFLKLAFFMTLELGAFPLGIGLMIDMCTVPLWPGVTIMSRLDKLRAGPFGVMFLDWLIGTMFMYQFATLLSHIRTLCRPGTLFFIRDPADPNYSPVKDIVEKSAFSQLRKLGTSAVMYSVIVFTLFGGSCWTLAYIPYIDFLPLRLDPTFGPLTSIPFDLLFLHLVVPPTIKYIRPRHRARKLLNIWWKSTISLFRLNTLMARRTALHDHTKLSTRPNKLDKLWPILDPICRYMFGKYDPVSTKARVPASDQVILLPPAQRKAEGGVFIALTEGGTPHNPADKMRLLKQDRRAREAGRIPERDYEVIHLPKFWRTRVHTFIGTTLLMASFVLAFSTFGPIIIGRMASNLVSNGSSKSVHDGYNWLFGAYIMYLSLSLGLFARRHIMTLSKAARLRRSARSTRIKRTFIRYLAGAYGLFTVYGVVPFCIGLLGDIYGSSFSWQRKGAVDARMVVHFWNTWAMGVVVCSLGVGLMSNVKRMKPTKGSLMDKLKDQFKNPFPRDLSTTHKVVWPVIQRLLWLNITPFLATFIILLTFKGELSDETHQAIGQAVTPIFLRIHILIGIKDYLKSGWGKMRQEMIDAEYVLEEKVENFDPIKEEEEKKKREEMIKKKKEQKENKLSKDKENRENDIDLDDEDDNDDDEEKEEEWEDENEVEEREERNENREDVVVAID